MNTATNDLKYFPEDELENIIAEVRKKRQQKLENHLASKSLALGSSNVHHMMEIFQNEKRNFDPPKEISSNREEIEKTDFCQCIDNGCECVQNRNTKDKDCNERKTSIRETKNIQSSRNDVKALLLPEEILFRLNNILNRLVTSLDQFKKHVKKHKIDDEEDEDKDRKVKRANEFVTRFSRNYLYQLKRQIDLLKNEKSCKFDDLYKKLYLAFQTTVQAIQTCLKSTAHSSITPCKKMSEFLKETVVLYDYCMEELKPSPELEKLKSLTNEVFVVLEELSQTLEKAEASVRAKAHKKRIAKQPKNNVPKKLSMYCSSSLPKDCWEKKSSKLARKKFGPPKSKNIAEKRNKASPKQSERSLGNKDGKLPMKGNEKMECDSESEKLKINNFEDTIEMVKRDSVLDGKLLRTAIENEINDDDDLGIPIPCDAEKRLELFLLADTLTELTNLRGKMDNKEPVDNSSHEETFKENLHKVVKQINEMFKSSSDVNSKQLDSKSVEKSNVANSKLICIKHDENYEKKQRKQEYNKSGIISEDGKRLCIPLCVDEETVEACKLYRSEFEEYKNTTCCDPDGFLNLVERSADVVILKLVDSIADEMEDGMSLLTDKLYELELKEVCS